MREFGGAAEFGGGDFAEDEAVVPLAAGLLQCFELGGQAVGCDGGARGGFGKVASELGLLADVVKTAGVLHGFGGELTAAACCIPVMNQAGELCLGEDGRLCGSQFLQ